MSLEVYQENGFKFFPCRSDKSPDTLGFWPEDKERKKYNKKTGNEKKNYDWMQPENHISIDKAEELQKTGTMIGAWIPEDLIVIDLDKHEGKADGLKSFQDVKKQLVLDINFVDDTTVIQTGGGGFHVFFFVGNDHTFSQGALKLNNEEIGIDIKTNKGYIIASNSPGYTYLCESDPMELPEKLNLWLTEVQKNSKIAIEDKTNIDTEDNRKTISPKLLKSILGKTDIKNFRSNDRWLQFIMSAVSASGSSSSVIGLLEEWSNSDPEYSEDRSILNRIESITENGGITIGTFISTLREEGLSPYLINQVVKIDSITMAVLDGEAIESKLPIEEPDYDKIIELPEMKEFFTIQGNSSAKTILYNAFKGNIIYNKGEKESFYFNGSRWEVLKDMYSIVYTILFRCAKIYYMNSHEGKENQDRMMKIINSINDTTWKSKTITELNAMIREDGVNWDSIAIRESITTKDGVIDFSNGKLITRDGKRSEFRLKYIDYTTEEIINSPEPTHYNNFMRSTFPDEETLFMANELVSLCISGNTEKRIFQLWEGEGSNGKSTLIDIIKEIMKGKTNTYPPKMLMPDKYDRGLSVTPELATFQGSYAAVGIEVDQSSEFSMGIIKNLTGGDTITANPKHKAQIEFDPTWQLILAVNDLPRFNSLDGAFVGRLCILPFVMSFPRDESEELDFLKKGIKPKQIGEKKDKKKMLTEIYSQKAGIIRFMIETYCNLEKNSGYVKQSPESLEKKKYYIRDNDDFGKFIDDNCVIETDAFCSSEEITEAFKDYMGMKKASPKWVISNVKKHNKQIQSDSRDIIIKSEYGEERKRRRGLTGVRLKTQMEIVSSMNNEIEAKNLTKKYNDDIGF